MGKSGPSKSNVHFHHQGFVCLDVVACLCAYFPNVLIGLTQACVPVVPLGKSSSLRLADLSSFTRQSAMMAFSTRPATVERKRCNKSVFLATAAGRVRGTFVL